MELTFFDFLQKDDFPTAREKPDSLSMFPWRQRKDEDVIQIHNNKKLVQQIQKNVIYQCLENSRSLS